MTSNARWFGRRTSIFVIPSLTALADGRFLWHTELVDDPAELDFDVAFDHFYDFVG